MADDQDKLGTERPYVELFIKASLIDRERKGSCPFCQQWFMSFFLLYEDRKIDLSVKTVYTPNPPAEFTALGAGDPPVVRIVHSDVADNLVLDHNDAIETYLKRTWGMFEEPAAEKETASLYNKFNLFLKNTNMSDAALVQELRKLNNFLKKNGKRFLQGDLLTYNDCETLPKLQHIRVAGKAYRDFDIPADLEYVWAYMENAYSLRTFTESCPADQDIIIHYEKKAGSRCKTGNPYLQEPTYSMTVANGAAAEVEEEEEEQFEEQQGQE